MSEQLVDMPVVEATPVAEATSAEEATEAPTKVAEIATPAKLATPSIGPTMQLYNLYGVRAFIAQHYGHVYNELEVEYPPEFRDGAVVNFIDPKFGAVIASCKCVMDSGLSVLESGVAVIGVHFRDVTMGKHGRHPIKWT